MSFGLAVCFLFSLPYFFCCNSQTAVAIEAFITEGGSLEVKLLTTWTDEKQRWEESEEKRREEEDQRRERERRKKMQVPKAPGSLRAWTLAHLEFLVHLELCRLT